MYDIDAAAMAHREANPPPDWWPIPPPSVGRVYQYHPVVGPPTGGNFAVTTTDPDPDLAEVVELPPAAVVQEPPAADTARMSSADILAHVFPGDSLGSIARRLGYTQAGLRYLRHRRLDLAAAIDLRRMGRAPV